MNNAISYDALCVEFHNLWEKAHSTLNNMLNNRGVETINVMAYIDADMLDICPSFSQTDKNGYGVNVTLKLIHKDKNGDWVVDVVDEDYDDWDTLNFDQWNFDAGALIDVIGVIEEIFEIADDQYNGKVLGVGENFEEE